MFQKLTIQEMQHIAKTRGGRCLSPIYVNSSTHLIWECSCGNIWKAVPARIKRGAWCVKCGFKKAWTKRERPSYREIAEQIGCSISTAHSVCTKA